MISLASLKKQISISKRLPIICLLALVFPFAGVSLVSGAVSGPFTIDTSGSVTGDVSAAFTIDTQAADVAGGGSLSPTFTINTQGADPSGGGSLSLAFVIDTRSVDPAGGGALSGMFQIDTREITLAGAALSDYFTIDTREDAEKLAYKYQLWAAANAPAGQRGMHDVTDLFGISNLMAFALGWEAGDSDTWYRAHLHEIVKTGANPHIGLRAHRRNDLPELIWTWTHSDDLTGFPTAPSVIYNLSSGIGGEMEKWDIHVPLPSSMEKNFYRLEVTCPNP